MTLRYGVPFEVSMNFFPALLFNCGIRLWLAYIWDAVDLLALHCSSHSATVRIIRILFLTVKCV